jgi:chromosomal replication initiation ATPase DnaA
MKAMPTIKEVVDATAKVTKIPADVLLNTSYRARHVTRARHIAQYVARTVAYRTWPEITSAFGQKHPSAYSGAAKIEAELKEGNTLVKKVVDAVSKAVQR